jgi:hypothetical protein
MTPEEQALFGIEKLNVVRSEIPAVTHIDYSARIQTVHANTNPLFHRLLKRFKALTGCPVLVNTSSMYAVSRSSAHPRTHSAVLWAMSLICSWSAAVCCINLSRMAN